MKKLYLVLPACCIIFLLYSCSKKTVPTQPVPQSTVVKPTLAKTTVNKSNSADTMMVNKVDSAITTKAPVKVIPKPAEPTPKVITVNDKAAKKTIDGRYYYDLLGHRYWRNNKDGKYYLYNKSMHNNPAFKKPQ